MKEIKGKRFSVFCNPEGRITEILQDENQFLPSTIVGNMLFSIVDPSDLDKILNFFLELKREKTAISWEINVVTEKGAETFTFFGGVFEDQIGIAASTNKDGAEFLFDEISRINNEQTNIIRTLSKENEKKKVEKDEPPVAYYEELSRLNNDLVNMQRELSKKNRELDELNKLKNQFLGIAAHDLRNPLGVIMNFSDFLLEDLEKELSGDQLTMLNAIQTSSEFMLHLLEDLLDITAIESGKLNLDIQKVDLLDLIQKNVHLNANIAAKKNISIQVEVTEHIPTVNIDTNKIEQVLNNLISNAIKFSLSNTTIKIKISQFENEVNVSVIDQGPGIPAHEIDKLFKPFQKTSVKATGGEKSTGLGLSIVRNIVQGHGGEVSVQSEIGVGSTFCFSLPIEF
jgi:two-component system, OmpR family, sensor kinase